MSLHPKTLSGGYKVSILPSNRNVCFDFTMLPKNFHDKILKLLKADKAK